MTVRARRTCDDGASVKCDGVVTSWVVTGLLLWVALAFAVALVIGRGIRLADRRAGQDALHTTAGLDRPWTGPSTSAPVRPRAIPVPPIGFALIALALALEATGYAVRLGGAAGATGRILSMDAPLSLPRMYVAALFAAGALLALAGAGRIPGRRNWWLAVGLVGSGIALVKGGGTVHVAAMRGVQAALGGPAALALSVLVAGLVVGALLFLSRSERRDRRRVIGVLTLYAGASVGLSALSSAMPTAALAAAATFVEESGEALAGVGFLLAVLAGVAPRLVLPGAWRPRRAADEHTLEVADPLGGRVTGQGARS